MNHEQYIKRCLEIAKKGIGTTRPNPSVGSVIVVDDKIIGEGYTSPYGGNHAEVNAIKSVNNKALFKEATIYVTLEPCSHFGKTPPCSDLIIKSGIKKIVIGCVDSNSLVSGKGIERLKNAGCEVVVGILKKECLKHHKRFFTFHNKKRPYIILKWAVTKDGFIAPKYRDERKPVWITNEISRQLVHQWRAQEHAILVGVNTVLKDNPKLNVRLSKGLNPIRIVIDKDLKIPKESYVYDKSVKTIFITGNKVQNVEDVFFEFIDFSSPLAIQICQVLFKHQIQSLIVEGGAKTLQTFIDENLWDEARVFKGDVNFETGTQAPNFIKKYVHEQNLQKDILRVYSND